MSRRCSAFVIGAVAVTFAWTAPGFAADVPTPAKFGFGNPATSAEIAGWDIDVRPDGAGLPAGRGSVAEGQAIYDEKCAACHGTFGESTDYMALAGGVGTLRSDAPVRTTGSKLNHATTLFDYIRRAMPFANPKTLRDDEVYALTAYVLHLNDILPADATLDRDTIVKVAMPNRDGLTTAHGFTRVDGKPDTRNVACMKDCVQSIRLSSQMPDYARDSHGNLAEQTRPMGAVEGVDTSQPASGAAAAKAVIAARSASPGDTAKTLACMTCHGVSTRIVGPAFREVARKYAGDAAAESHLTAKVRQGGGGNWGSVPMPAQPQVSEAQAQALVQWILAGAR